MFEKFTKITIHDSLADKTYLIFIASVLGAYAIYTLFAIVACILRIKAMEEVVRQINKSYQVYEQAKYYGEIEKNNLDAYLGTNTMPTAEERSFLLS